MEDKEVDMELKVIEIFAEDALNYTYEKFNKENKEEKKCFYSIVLSKARERRKELKAEIFTEKSKLKTLINSKPATNNYKAKRERINDKELHELIIKDLKAELKRINYFLESPIKWLEYLKRKKEVSNNLFKQIFFRHSHGDTNYYTPTQEAISTKIQKKREKHLKIVSLFDILIANLTQSIQREIKNIIYTIQPPQLYTQTITSYIHNTTRP